MKCYENRTKYSPIFINKRTGSKLTRATTQLSERWKKIYASMHSHSQPARCTHHLPTITIHPGAQTDITWVNNALSDTKSVTCEIDKDLMWKSHENTITVHDKFIIKKYEKRQENPVNISIFMAHEISCMHSILLKIPWKFTNAKFHGPLMVNLYGPWKENLDFHGFEFNELLMDSLFFMAHECPVNMEIIIDHDYFWIFSWHFNCLCPIGLSGFSWCR